LGGLCASTCLFLETFKQPSKRSKKTTKNEASYETTCLACGKRNLSQFANVIWGQLYDLRNSSPLSLTCSRWRPPHLAEQNNTFRKPHMYKYPDMQLSLQSFITPTFIYRFYISFRFIDS
jgi:hypothetical protein